RMVLFILIDHGLEMRERVGEASLFERNAAELEMRVGFARIDGDRLPKARDGLCVLAALLVNQSELVARSRVVRIDRGRFEHPPEALALPESCAEIGQLAAKIVVGVEEEERRGEPSEDIA